MTQEVEERKYDYESVERKWQHRWDKAGVFNTDVDKGSEKYFINVPYPYLNASMHLGHGYTVMKAEAMARFQRMLGRNVLFPFAFHATGEPIVGAAKRVKSGDKAQIRTLELSGVPPEEIKHFHSPEYIVEYFKNKWIHAITSLGLAIDWRREFVTTELTPTYSKFIEWQYRKLKREGYVVQDSHPVIWCPADLNPTGDHDRLEGEGARVVDFVVVKFYSKKHGAYYLPATLRPETTYGVTNMFLHPEGIYVKFMLNDVPVITSEETIIKFRDQQFDVGEIEKIPIEDLIGEYVKNPVNDEEVLVLPGDFIDSGGSTGVVMSVPAHAPMDWITLENLKEDPSSLEKWGISEDQVKSIDPIALIELDEYGEYPAGEEVENRGIKSRNDAEVSEATKTIYRKELKKGKLLPITGKYSSMGVEEVKDKIIADFMDDEIAFILKEPGEPVVCRCGTRNHVKYLENQWFLKFSDEEWKERTHRLIDSMDVFPEDARNAFHKTVDWLENKACARRSGMGTPMPWDTDWIIETLSDSVIYMAYYIVSKYVNSGEFKISFATDEVYDYIMLGNGDPTNVARTVDMPVELLKEIRNELEYFYPFDLRSSGKDLMQNHLTFMLMHHTAIFPEKYWPKGVAVNGYVAIIEPGSDEAVKMSKSKGNFQTIEDVVDAFGVDATRLGFLIAGEGLKDAQFSLDEADSYVKWIQNLYNIAFEEIDDNDELQIDRWLFSRVQSQITTVRDELSKMHTRTAFQAAYHELLQDIKWYTKRRGSKGPAYKYAIKTMIMLVCPFIPHVVEEIWEEWGNTGFATNANYPEPKKEMVDKDAEHGEKFLSSFIDDIKNLKNFLLDDSDKELKKIEVFVAPKWKYLIYNEAYENGLDDLIKRVMKNPKVRSNGKSAAKYCQDLMKDGAPPDFSWSKDLEINTLNEAQEYIVRQARAEVEIINAETSDHPKSKAAIPRRPGINFVLA